MRSWSKRFRGFGRGRVRDEEEGWGVRDWERRREGERIESLRRGMRESE